MANAQLPALLQVIEPLLLLHVRVGVDLEHELLRVLLEGGFPLLCDLSLPVLRVLLCLDDFQEFFSLFLCLLMQGLLLVQELLLSGFFQICQQSNLLFVLEFLLEAGLPFLRFKRSLSSECIDICLPIGRLLLHLPELGDLSLLLFADPPLHLLPLKLGLLLCLHVPEDGLILFLLSEFLGFFEGARSLVG